MLGEVFYWIFNMSIAAALTGLIVLLLKKIKRIPRRYILILWIIPLIRMWIPVAVGSSYSLMSVLSKITAKTIVVYNSQVDITMMNHLMAADTYFPITYLYQHLAEQR